MAAYLTTPLLLPYRLSLLFSTLLGLHGFRSRSLSLSGALTAFLLGYLTLANPLRVFGVALLAFYLTGSRVTKIKSDYKATLESPSPCLSLPGAPAGVRRTSTQVLCNAYLGTLCAVLFRLLYSGEYADGRDWSSLHDSGRLWLPMAERGARWCVLESGPGWSRALVLGAVAFWSACAGDTFASELGILSHEKPVLITTLKPVPRGTNGGVSLLGLGVSVLGGCVVAFASAVSLMWENPECGWRELGETILVGAGSGLVGSLIDSLLGATVQESLYDRKTDRIIHSRIPIKSDNTEIDKKGKDDIISLAGIPLLSNNQVNFVSAGLTGLMVIWWARPVG